MLAAGLRPVRVHDQRFSVSFDYPVVFCRGIFQDQDPALAWAISRQEPQQRHRVCAVLDRGLVKAMPELATSVQRYVARYQEVLELCGDPLIVPGGEAAKNDLKLIGGLCETFRDRALDRHAVVLVVGGGAVLDAVGYAAAIFHRGIRLVRMPSTVLSQSDGGVGVKNGVNALDTKNLIGTFAPPFAVVSDGDLLKTLDMRNVRAGMAEAVKVALIRDGYFFEWMEQHATDLARGSPAELEFLVQRAAHIHLAQIAQGGDPFELGSSRPLDYGHWAAHKLEILSNHELLHGEAVAIGMLLDARYAERAGLLAISDFVRIARLLGALGLPRTHAALTERHLGTLKVLAGLEEFREHLGGVLTIPLLTGIGRTVEVSEMDARLVADAIAWLSEGAEV